MCLSAQSNPQGVPKELLEAKKLELIQEKVVSQVRFGGRAATKFFVRSTPRRQQKKRGVERIRKSYEIGILTTYASVNEENEGNEDEAVAEGVEGVRTMIVVRLDTPGLRHQDVMVPLIEMSTEVRYQGVKSIHIFPRAVEGGIRMTGDAALQASYIPLFVLRHAL